LKKEHDGPAPWSGREESHPKTLEALAFGRLWKAKKTMTFT